MQTLKRIKITSDCNQDCIFCSEKKYNQPPFKNSEIIKQIKNKEGATHINFTGGEPTLSPNLIKYIKLARTAGYKTISLYTNACRFKDNAYTKSLKHAGLSKAIVSIQHFNPLMADIITNTKSSFNNKVCGLKNLITKKIDIIANIVIFSLNYKILKNIVDFLYANYNLKKYMFSFLEPNCQKVRQKPWLIPDLKTSLPALKQTIEYCDKKKLISHIPYNGALPICVFSKYNIKINNPDIIKGSDADQNSRSYEIFCRYCHEIDTCMGFVNEYKNQCLEIILKK